MPRRPDRRERQPSLNDTRITITSHNQIAKLEQIMCEYQTQAAQRGYVTGLEESSVAAISIHAWQSHVVAATLEAILEYSYRWDRETSPVSLTMSNAVYELDHFVDARIAKPAGVAATIPAVYVPHKHGYRPDVRRTWQAGGPTAATFARAYGIAQDLCAPEPHLHLVPNDTD